MGKQADRMMEQVKKNAKDRVEFNKRMGYLLAPRMVAQKVNNENTTQSQFEYWYNHRHIASIPCLYDNEKVRLAYLGELAGLLNV